MYQPGKDWWSSTKHHINNNMPDAKPTMRWNIVSKARNGLYYLEFVEFKPGCSGATVFEQIQQLCLPGEKVLSERLSSLLYSPVVYTSSFIKV
jgi:hypothetical protein